MKNILTTIAGAILVLFLFIIMPGIAGYIETHYTKKDCTIVEITENYAVAVDAYGDEWAWAIEGTELKIGDKVNLKIYNGHTDFNMYDDEVVGVN